MTEVRGSRRLRAALLLAAVLCSPLLPAATVVTIKVTVLESPPCIINSNNTLEVQFNTMMTTRVDGVANEQDVTYSVECTGNSSSAMKLQIGGVQAGTGFADNVLQTDKAGLGIAIKVGGSPVALNSWTDFTYPELPLLSVVPVKAAGVTLSGGKFTAAATMRVEYQ